MYLVTKNYISGKHELYDYCVATTMAAKLLYNASLFRIRNHFTARSKEVLTPNELEVEQEIRNLKESGLWNHDIGSVLTYNVLEKMMRVNKNPDFFDATLSMQTSQQVIKAAVGDFKNWLKSLKDYKKNPSKYLGKPQMPHYAKSDRKTFTMTNQDCICIDDQIKFPLTKAKLLIKTPEGGRLKEVRFKPYYDGFLIFCTFECEDLVNNTSMPYMAGIDFGISNIAAVATNEGHTLLFQGGAVKAENQYFNKKKAKLTSVIIKGHETTHRVTSHRLQALSMHRDMFLHDQMHKISAEIVAFCIAHKVGTIVLGTNKHWKQNVSIGKQSNQNFVSMPLAILRQMITYKAERAGITVVEQEESYTSKASFLDNDFIPVYGKEEGTPIFSGERIKRGLYRFSNGVIVNADLNGAANILRKAFPDAFTKVKDFAFLQSPIVYGFC